MGSASSRYATSMEIYDLIYKQLFLINYKVEVSVSGSYIDFDNIELLDVR